MSLFLYKRAYLLLLALLYNIAASASGSIAGKITDANSSKPIEGVNVYLSELKRSAITDAFGKFEFNNVPEGTYSIDIALVGYNRISATVNVHDDTRVTVNYALT